jgi:hypothetical protein
MNKFGSHWRWRTTLAIALIALAMFALWQVSQSVERRVLVGGGGPPLLVENLGRDFYSVEAIDQASEKSRTILEWRGHDQDDQTPQWVRVLDGRAIAFVKNQVLQLVETSPPHERVEWKLPESVSGRVRIRGISSDQSFAVFEVGFSGHRFVGLSGGPGPPSVVVVELATQRIVTKEENIYVRARGTLDEYVFWGDSQSTPARESYYRRLNNQGEWVDLSLPKVAELLLSRKAFIRRAQDGGLQIVADEDDPVLPGMKPQAPVPQLADTNNRYLVRYGRDYYLGDLDSPTPTDLVPLVDSPGAVGLLTSAEFQSNGQAVAFADSWGNVFQIDLNSRQIKAISTRGSNQYRTTMGIVVSLAVLAILYLSISLRECSLAWALSDAMLAIWLAVGIATLTSLAYVPFRHVSLSPLQSGVQHWTILIAVGIVGAGLYVVAWYWAFGRGALLWRILAGLASLVGLLTPFVLMVYFQNFQMHTSGYGEWMMGSAVALTGLFAFILSIPRWFGWGFGTGEDGAAATKSSRRTFGLAAIFTLITILAIALAVDRAIDLRQHPWHIYPRELAGIICGFAPSLGVLLPIVFTLERSRHIAISLTVMAIGTAVEVAVIWEAYGGNVAMELLVARSAGVILAGLLPFILLRRHGYRWRSATSTAEPAAVP